MSEIKESAAPEIMTAQEFYERLPDDKKPCVSLEWLAFATNYAKYWRQSMLNCAADLLLSAEHSRYDYDLRFSPDAKWREKRDQLLKELEKQ